MGSSSSVPDKEVTKTKSRDSRSSPEDPLRDVVKCLCGSVRTNSEVDPPSESPQVYETEEKTADNPPTNRRARDLSRTSNNVSATFLKSVTQEVRSKYEKKQKEQEDLYSKQPDSFMIQSHIGKNGISHCMTSPNRAKTMEIEVEKEKIEKDADRSNSNNLAQSEAVAEPRKEKKTKSSSDGKTNFEKPKQTQVESEIVSKDSCGNQLQVSEMADKNEALVSGHLYTSELQ